MRLVVLCSRGLPSLYLAHALASRHEALVLYEREKPLAPLVRVWRRRGGFLKKLDRTLFFAWYALALAPRVRRALEARLGPPPEAPRGPTVADLSSPAAVSLARGFRPDAVVSFGIGILKGDWLRFSAPVLNAHTGLLPRYRGRFCWLWPWLEGDLEGFAVTLHEVVAKVDAGAARLVRRVPATEVADPTRIECLLAAITVALRDALLDLPAALTSAPGSPAGPPGRHYLEPGLTDYLRLLRSTPFPATSRREATGG